MEYYLNHKYGEKSEHEIISLILKNDLYSDEAAFFLLRYRLFDDLKTIYSRYHISDELGDVLSDFLLYIRNGRGVTHATPYECLNSIRENSNMKAWIHSTFSNFMYDRNKAEMRRQSKGRKLRFNDYPQIEQENKENKEVKIMEMSILLAWVIQDSEPDQRFMLYRHLLHIICHEEVIDNQRMAEALGITYGNYRVRDSRLDDRLHKYIDRMRNNETVTLDGKHSELSMLIYENFDDLAPIIKQLYEENLPNTSHWEEIQRLREQINEESNSKLGVGDGLMFSFEDEIANEPPVKPDFTDLTPRGNTLHTILDELLK